MNFDDVSVWLQTRLGGRKGDRGWFVITRVHTDVDWIYQIAAYLHSVEDVDGIIRMTDSIYLELGNIACLASSDPGVQLRRHHLLVMNKPLQLIEKVNGRNWGTLTLTDFGRQLAVSADPRSVMELCLNQIHFAVAPTCPDDRAEMYSEFNVFVYSAMREILSECGGYIDRNEYDLFVSRIRNAEEISQCINLILSFRTFSSDQKVELIDIIRGTFSEIETKSYQNWRDMALHTFSLFSLGKSMIRDEQTLCTVDYWRTFGSNITVVDNVAGVDAVSSISELRIPEPSMSEFLVPPSIPAINNGVAAESFVAEVYQSEGWNVQFYTNKRGYGFDLWAIKGEVSVFIEVKSSVDLVSSVNLTENEYRAAEKYREQYILALVDYSGKPKQRLRLLMDPYGKLQFNIMGVCLYSAVVTD